MAKTKIKTSNDSTSSKPVAPNLRVIHTTPARADFQLAPDEMRLVQAYRKFDGELQEFWLRSLEVSAPNEQPKAHGLRLVAGGAA